MNRAVLSLVVIVLSSLCSQAGKLEQALADLDILLVNRMDFINAKHASIDSLKEIYAQAGDGDGLLKIAEAYTGLSADSAIVYADRAQILAAQAGDSVKARRAAILLAANLGKAALFDEAYRAIGKGYSPEASRGEKLAYYGTLGRINIDEMNYHSLQRPRQAALDKAIAALDSSAVLLPEKNLARRMINAQRQFLKGDTAIALGEMYEVLAKLDTADPSYAVATGLMAGFYQGQEDKREEYAYYLAISAAADARNANLEAASLINLGNELFANGDFERAYEYLSIAGEEISMSGDKSLYVSIVPTLSNVIEAMQLHERDQRHHTIIIYLLLAIIIIALAFAVYNQSRSARHLEERNSKLEKTLSSRDKYIQQLLDMCSFYVESYEETNKLVARKLKTGQSSDLLQKVESGKLMQSQTEGFFKVFDNAVFNIFPNFLKEVNELLLPGQQLESPAPGKLNPELRIVAFLRLGVTDSTKLSRFLDLSLNTVYTYRNRLKKRAKNRENFEAEVQKIGKVS